MNSPTTQPRCAARGFTLLELIISVALVLVLMLAVTKIFSITSATIGATQGIAAATRDARAAQAVFARDMAAMASDSPFIWINVDGPRRIPAVQTGTFQAFRNAADEKSDIDGDPQTIDIDGNGQEGEASVTGEIIRNYDVNSRNHRLDQFSFCARDSFIRQTGNSTPDTLVSQIKSNEAWIYYGPLTLPNNSGTFYLSGTTGTKTGPGNGTAQSNPNNYYASQWALGRFAPLMIQPPTNDIREGDPVTGILQEYYPHSTAGSMTPFSFNTQSIHNTAPDVPSMLVNGRYDLVGTSISNARQIITDFTGATGWWENILSSYMEINPFVIKPIRAATAARQVPIFIPACSQFMVEFAGDFCTQDELATSPTYGKALVDGSNVPLPPDGKVDFALKNGQRVIRWYGYPRNTDDVAGISVATLNNDSDVVTVSDFVMPIGSDYSTKAAPTRMSFEHASASTTPKTRKTYAVNAAAIKYFAAWGPDSIDNPAIPRPKMYRITLSIDRPEMAGRSADPQTFEYVFNVP